MAVKKAKRKNAKKKRVRKVVKTKTKQGIEWNRDVALVTFVAAALITAVALFSVYLIMTSSELKLSPEKAKKAALNFIQTNLVEEGTKVSIPEITEEHGLYKLTVVLSNENASNTVTSYITVDGKLFFTGEKLTVFNVPEYLIPS